MPFIKLSSGSLAGFVLSVAVSGFAISFGIFGKAHPSSSNLDHRCLGVGVLHDACEFEASPRIPAIQVRVHRLDPHPDEIWIITRVEHECSEDVGRFSEG
jgi:hypothetical protein